MDKKNKLESFRNFIQVFWALITNSFFVGFKQGKIYTGQSKKICLPGLNCYSCPGALGSCPIGAMQAVIGSRNFKFSFYVSGFLIFIGALFGRFICGWLCPFGFVQDILHKIPFPKKIKTFRIDKFLRMLKYVIFALFVIILPMFVVDATGLGDPFFCKYICPSGTLEGSVPLLIVNEPLRNSIGFLYAWKVAILIILLLISVVIYRPFCKYICPLGAVYSLFNKISVLKINKDEDKCISCNVCTFTCKMNVDVMKNVNSTECIRCGACVKSCPTDALSCLWVSSGRSGVKDTSCTKKVDNTEKQRKKSDKLKKSR